MKKNLFLLFVVVSTQGIAQVIGIYGGMNKSIKEGISNVTSNKANTGFNIGVYKQFKGSLFRHAKIELNYSTFRGTLDGQVGQGSHYKYSSSYKYVRYADFTDHRVLLGISFFEFSFCNKKLLIIPGFQLGCSVSNKIEGTKENVSDDGQTVVISYSPYTTTEKFNYLQCGVSMNMSYLIPLNKSNSLFIYPDLRVFSAYEYAFTPESNVRSGFSFNLGVRKMLSPKTTEEKSKK